MQLLPLSMELILAVSVAAAFLLGREGPFHSRCSLAKKLRVTSFSVSSKKESVAVDTAVGRTWWSVCPSFPFGACIPEFAAQRCFFINALLLGISEPNLWC
mmetsp:Transcript_17881/g.41700  ORF Transcript_17881/g.41700 Transcript_17881/m.41700 type:complete len:101 (-) Transcript_17881:34-336(-)